MSQEESRRRARALVDDAMDRLREGGAAFVLTHVAASLPFYLASVDWFVEVDLAGAAVERGAGQAVLCVVPKMLGWGALAAWSAERARGRPLSIGGAWKRSLARLPEVLLAGSLAVVFFFLGWFSLLGFLGVIAALVALAAAVGRPPAGGLGALRQGWQAVLRDGGRSTTIGLLCACLWLFLVVNLMVLPYAALALGAGGLGADLSLAARSFLPDRSASWALSALAAALLVEGVLVASCAELQADREAEREGVRFERFAEELERRDVRTPGPRTRLPA